MTDALLVHISTNYIEVSSRLSDPQLGQYYIAEYAYRNGYNIKIKKLGSNEPIISTISNLLIELECKAVGFYVDSENIWTIRRIIFDIKQNVPGAIVFLGGPQVTGDPKKALQRVFDADFAIVGEGEITTTELLKNNWNYKDPNILGIAYVDSKGNFQYSGSRPQPRDLDCYPFPIRERYALDDNLQFNQILTGRGCIGRCAFCFEGSKTNNILRLRSVENVCEEIEYLASKLPEKSYITFLDDTFIMNPKRTTEICEWMIKRYNGEIKWYCEARVDILLKNLDLLPLMKKAGLLRIQLGGESGNQQILDSYNKGMRIEDLKKVVKYIYEAGIDSVYINYIVGGAFETLETFKQTVELAEELMEIAPGCAEVGCSLFAPYPGSPIYNNPEKYGLKILDRDLITGPDSQTAFVETQELSKAKLIQLKNIFENSVNGKCDKLIETLSYEQKRRHFEIFTKYNVTTFWHRRMEKMEGIYNYFNAIFLSNFSAFNDLNQESIQNAVPFRTMQELSDGENIMHTVYGKEIIVNTDFENSVIALSAGKVSYWEIKQILKKKYPNMNNLEQKLFETYKSFDDKYMVVWKTLN